jgi:hypothetical protein
LDPRALLYLCAFLAPRRPHRQPGPRPRLPAADRIIATALAGTMGGTSGISMMLILLALITFAAALGARETKSESLLG